MFANVVDYDSLREWSPMVGSVISSLGGERVTHELASLEPEYIEDARDWIYDRFGRGVVVDALAGRLSESGFRLYHGTRLADDELDCVRQNGLTPLRLGDRAQRLSEILRLHPRWTEVEHKFSSAIELFGAQARAGRREDGCVHACFSRAGLISGCNHYLAYGAEVDGHVAYHLFGDNSARKIFNRHRSPYLVSFVLPYVDVVCASHAFGDIEAGQNILIDKFIGAWAFSQSRSDFSIESQQDCWAAKIPGVINADLLNIESIRDDMMGIII